MGWIEGPRFCPHCERRVSARRRTPSHLLHLILSLVSFGLWLPVWLIVAIGAGSGHWLCSVCGSATRPLARDDDAVKHCPRCAEPVRAAAVACRYCGFEFPR